MFSMQCTSRGPEDSARGVLGATSCPPGIALRKAKSCGFSLIEIMVALAIGLFLSLAVTDLFISQKSALLAQTMNARLQDDGRIALEVLSRDLRAAGYFGCAGLARTENLQAPPAAALEPIVRGYEYEAQASASGLTGATIRSDVVDLVGAYGYRAQLKTPMAAPTAVVVAPVGTEAVAAGDAMVVSDCLQGTLFVVTGIGAQGGEASSISHSGVANTRDGFAQAYGVGSEVARIDRIAYFVGSVGDGADNSGLWRYSVAHPNERLLLSKRVADLDLKYATDADDDGLPDAFGGGDAIADWKAVRYVRFELLMKSDKPNLPVPMNYRFRGVETTAKDSHTYVVVETTVRLRNPMN